MTTKDALRGAMDEQEWTATRVATTASVSEGAVYKWLRGKPIGGPALLALMNGLPGFAERLGFQAVQRAA
jgi:hypothetical protein